MRRQHAGGRRVRALVCGGAVPLGSEPATHWPSALKERLAGLELRSWRVFTVLLYANDAWEAPHAGCLRVHHEGGGHTDVEPRGGRCVVLNALLAHEVLPAREHEHWALSLGVWREDAVASKYELS